MCSFRCSCLASRLAWHVGIRCSQKLSEQIENGGESLSQPSTLIICSFASLGDWDSGRLFIVFLGLACRISGTSDKRRQDRSKKQGDGNCGLELKLVRYPSLSSRKDLSKMSWLYYGDEFVKAGVGLVRLPTSPEEHPLVDDEEQATFRHPRSTPSRCKQIPPIIAILAYIFGFTLGVVIR